MIARSNQGRATDEPKTCLAEQGSYGVERTLKPIKQQTRLTSQGVRMLENRVRPKPNPLCSLG